MFFTIYTCVCVSVYIYFLTMLKPSLIFGIFTSKVSVLDNEGVDTYTHRATTTKSRTRLNQECLPIERNLNVAEIMMTTIRKGSVTRNNSTNWLKMSLMRMRQNNLLWSNRSRMNQCLRGNILKVSFCPES